MPILTYVWTAGRWVLQTQAVGRQVSPACVLGSRQLSLVDDTGHGEMLLLVPQVRTFLCVVPLP
jgi:hypothetical protein